MLQHTVAAAAISLLAVTLTTTHRDSMQPNATTERASGTFEVKLAPLPTTHSNDAQLGRYSLDKTFHGDLVAAGKGEMLTATTPVNTSAVYVAIERITGTLRGKRGSFVLHHEGVMQGGGQKLRIAIVPDSGTEELAGISGTMEIVITDGKHFYELEYTLTKAP